MEKPIKSGCKVFIDSEVWVNWWVYPREASNLDINFEHQPYYLGPGQVFAHRVSIRRVGKRVLVAQHCGLDV